jgi:hypothetical protein
LQAAKSSKTQLFSLNGGTNLRFHLTILEL